MITRVPLSIFFGALGLILLAGGVKLALLGGSTYYCVAGVSLLLIAGLSWTRRLFFASAAYALFMLGTLGWSLAEVGFDCWSLMPRIAVPGALSLLFLPAMISWRSWSGILLSAMPAICVVVLLSATYLAGLFRPLPAVATQSPMSETQRLDWPAYGHSLAGDRFSPATQITPANIGELSLAWSYRTGDTLTAAERAAGTLSTFQAVPLQIGDSLYLCTPHNVVISLDAQTGKERWRFDPHLRTAGVRHMACRGVSYSRGTGSAEFCDSRLLMGTLDRRLIALDPETGRPCTEFGTAGIVDLSVGIGDSLPGYIYSTSPPTIIGDVAVVGSLVLDNQSNSEPSGAVRAFSVKTGAMLWAWDALSAEAVTTLAPGQTLERDSPNAWSVFSADPTLGLVYIPTGNSPPDFFGGMRTAAQDRYSSSVVALDIQTGSVRWSFQTTHHDIWDYDVPAQPVLIDIPDSHGAAVPAVVVPTKRGEIFVLDRRTGVPITEVVEKSVPGGAAPGERLSATQPFSVRMPSFAPRPLTEASMWGATLLDQLWCRIQFRSHRYDGAFTPQSTEGSIVYPGSFGVINWGSVSIDPDRKLMIVNTSLLPYVNRLIPRADADALGVVAHGMQPSHGVAPQPASEARGIHAQAGTPYAVKVSPFLSPFEIPCHQPPWGELAAVDLNSRQILWRRPLGTTEDHAPLGMPLPVGVFNLGGSITTRGGVVFIAATIDNVLRAFNSSTGEQIWSARLPAGGQSTPISYVSADSGRQFVVILAGGHTVMRTTPGDYVLAYALKL